jgi:DNA end-binding protein Ku
MLDLAVHIVETKIGHFEPDKFEDHYENALKALIEKKRRGEKIERPKEQPRAQVMNLMDALRQSVADGRGGDRSRLRRTAAHRERTTAGKGNTRVRKAS